MKICEPIEQAKTLPGINFSITLNQLYINGEWRDSHDGKAFPVIDLI